jgi:hemerythrin-like metal-binding protein
MTSQPWASEMAQAQSRIDAEHEVELALLDELRAAVAGGNRQAKVDLLAQLVEHTNVHFLSEQLLMRLTAYPDFEAHQQEHDQLIAQARALQAHVEAGEVEPTLRFIDAMRAWLTGHMDGRDRALERYLKQRRE